MNNRPLIPVLDEGFRDCLQMVNEHLIRSVPDNTRLLGVTEALMALEDLVQHAVSDFDTEDASFSLIEARITVFICVCREILGLTSLSAAEMLAAVADERRRAIESLERDRAWQRHERQHPTSMVSQFIASLFASTPRP